jgi:hypothetical protein
MAGVGVIYGLEGKEEIAYAWRINNTTNNQAETLVLV